MYMDKCGWDVCKIMLKSCFWTQREKRKLINQQMKEARKQRAKAGEKLDVRALIRQRHKAADDEKPKSE